MAEKSMEDVFLESSSIFKERPLLNHPNVMFVLGGPGSGELIVNRRKRNAMRQDRFRIRIQTYFYRGSIAKGSPREIGDWKLYR